MTNAHEAKVTARSMPVSTKHVIEISNYIRGKNVQKSKEFLENVLKMKSAVPMRRYRSAGHRKGKVGPGRYPQKATKEVLRLLKNLESNAQNKGLEVGALYIKTIIPNLGETIPRYGRNRGQAKRTHLEIVAEEAETKPKKEIKKKTEEKK
ncbi:MAG: 50S ribosomal protein L22 [Candidatus Nanoarchaeia archaeon]|nr:50S ribosomal protein L22 [Candidatus Nanoarchaeia archaeon]